MEAAGRRPHVYLCLYSTHLRGTLPAPTFSHFSECPPGHQQKYQALGFHLSLGVSHDTAVIHCCSVRRCGSPQTVAKSVGSVRSRRIFSHSKEVKTVCDCVMGTAGSEKQGDF